MSANIHLAVVCGGQSTEHEISLLSAANVVNALDKNRYDISIIYIDQQGAWWRTTDLQALPTHLSNTVMDTSKFERVTVQMGSLNQPLMTLDGSSAYPVDCFFPITHGTLGEDGTIQGLFELLNVAYVGADVLGSAVSMEKQVAKRLLRDAGLPVVDWQLLTAQTVSANTYADLAERFGNVMFVKPVSLGSSVGISKVRNQQEFVVAVEEALRFDEKIIVEPFIQGREIECSVLGNEKQAASLPGEIIPNLEFYSYEAKYVHDEGADVVTPADLPEALIDRIQQTSVNATQALHVEGMARVDYFVTDDEIFINEVNTIPGFTNISMYPKNWSVSGLAYAKLLDDLIALGLARHRRRAQLSHVRNELHEATMARQQQGE